MSQQAARRQRAAAAGGTLVVPLASNAHSLVAGSPVSRVRRRLKYASLLYGQVLLEAGVMHINAGPNGSTTLTSGGPPEGPQWQTARERSAAQKADFVLAIGAEDIPGVPAKNMKTVISSRNTIAWQATFEPFKRELPGLCDWVHFVVPKRNLPPEVQTAERSWQKADMENPALSARLPERLVRDLVVKHANHDLALAVTSGFAASMDTLHSHVVASRLDESGWELRGFSVPVLFPEIGDLPWAAILDLRLDPAVQRFREVLQEVELETTSHALDGDVERAIHLAYEKRLHRAIEGLGGVLPSVRRVASGFFVGIGIDVSMAAMSAPPGPGAALGTAVAGVQEFRIRRRARQRTAWVGIHEKIRGYSSI